MRKHGFSLMETLMAVGTLAMGMLFVGGTFLLGIHFSMVSTERTMGAIVADEAFAKIRFYGLDPNGAALKSNQQELFDVLTPVGAGELAYPSDAVDVSYKQYFWTALCRRVEQDSRLVQVTVFVTRRTVGGANYWARDAAAWPALTRAAYPRPLKVKVVQDATSANRLLIQDAVGTDSVNEDSFVNDGYMILDDQTGLLHRVLNRDPDQPDRLVLDEPWRGGSLAGPGGGWVWVVPPPAGGGRNPAIAVFQKIIRF